MQFIDDVELSGKRILVRVDYNISLNPDHTIANDERMRQSLPTLEYLLQRNNKLILISHLGQPEGRDPQFSLAVVAKHLQELLPHVQVKLVDDFQTHPDMINHQQTNELLLLENIRFYPGEKANDPEFTRQLAQLGEVYVNDAFSVSHRKDASVVGLPTLLPAYGGLLLKKEITMLSKVVEHPQKPFVAILGGAKISTKIKLIDKLMHLADSVIVGGGIANNFLKAEGLEIGKSICEEDAVTTAKSFLDKQTEMRTHIVLPLDVVAAASPDDTSGGSVKSIRAVTADEMILDIGPETQAHLGAIIGTARTLVWNGPVGYFENPFFRRGTDFLYYAITENSEAFSVVGGGETLAAISKEEYLEKISHISTGGGAMLDFIENGTLPGIQALGKTPVQTV